MIEFVDESVIEAITKNSPSGRNTRFLKASHSLWKRFQNYNKHKPFVLYEKGIPVVAIFATISEKTKYINLYEIVTVQGKERNGYARKAWALFVDYWHNKGMNRIKLSCTPDSIGFHAKNGLVFWSVDKQGSLRSDQPLMPSISEQASLRESALTDPNLVMPERKVCQKLKIEDIEYLNLSEKKLMQTYQAIRSVGDYWFRKHLNV